MVGLCHDWGCGATGRESRTRTGEEAHKEFGRNGKGMVRKSQLSPTNPNQAYRSRRAKRSRVVGIGDYDDDQHTAHPHSNQHLPAVRTPHRMAGTHEHLHSRLAALVHRLPAREYRGRAEVARRVTCQPTDASPGARARLRGHARRWCAGALSNEQPALTESNSG